MYIASLRRRWERLGDLSHAFTSAAMPQNGVGRGGSWCQWAYGQTRFGLGGGRFRCSLLHFRRPSQNRMCVCVGPPTTGSGLMPPRRGGHRLGRLIRVTSEWRERRLVWCRRPADPSGPPPLSPGGATRLAAPQGQVCTAGPSRPVRASRQGGRAGPKFDKS